MLRHLTELPLIIRMQHDRSIPPRAVDRPVDGPRRPRGRVALKLSLEPDRFGYRRSRSADAVTAAGEHRDRFVTRRA